MFVTLAELTTDTQKLYKKLYSKGIKPVGKKEVFREVAYFRAKKILKRKRKFLVNLYEKEAVNHVRNFV